MKSLALVGNPNVGKTTLFNALTGLNHHTGNYPGVTVEWKSGEARIKGQRVEIVDLPGTYSLSAHSPDEAVVVATLLNEIPSRPRPDGVVALVDASNPERNLYLLSQVLDLGLPCVVALNMVDVAASKGIKVDAKTLSKNLGVPVVPIRANHKENFQALEAAIDEMLNGKPATPPPPLCKDPRVAAEPSIIRERYAWARRMLVDAIERPETPWVTASDRIDRVLTHKVWGSLIFFLAMGAVFESVFSWAAPAMDFMDAMLSHTGAWLVSFLPPGPLHSLVKDGIFAGFSAVAVFVPQIAALFFFIALLEDCGYMARTAFLMDKLFARLGLSGRSFIPMLSSFACAVPGIMSTRTIENSKERLVTMLVAPLMSCSARLPVYAIMIGAFVPSGRIGGIFGIQALVLFGMYLVGSLTAIPVALVFKRILMKNVSPLFLIELPAYKWPDPRTVWRRMYHQSRAFVVRAGTVIVSVSVVVWALSYFPRPQNLAPLQASVARVGELPAPVAAGSTQNGLEQSFLGRLGRALEPAFRPLGWDYRITMAALASFPAREVVVSTLGTIFSLSEGEEEAVLRQRLKEAKWPDGRPLFNLAVAFSLMVFFALCAQCASTLVVIARESGSWKWAAVSFTYMTILAYIGAFLAYRAVLVLGA